MRKYQRHVWWIVVQGGGESQHVGVDHFLQDCQRTQGRCRLCAPPPPLSILFQTLDAIFLVPTMDSAHPAALGADGEYKLHTLCPTQKSTLAWLTS